MSYSNRDRTAMQNSTAPQSRLPRAWPALGIAAVTALVTFAALSAGQGGAQNATISLHPANAPAQAPTILDSEQPATTPEFDPPSQDAPLTVGVPAASVAAPAVFTRVSSGAEIPAVALRAYQFAAAMLAETDPACRLDWSLLAGIGLVESGHGSSGGATLDADGVSTPAIRGVALTGAGDVARISDTDGGRLDGDPVWDRAVGPMQFLPSTWQLVGVDADADGVRNPDDLDDAALGSAVYLCSGNDDLSTDAGRTAALLRYNHSQAYVDKVSTAAAGYAAGAEVPLTAASIGDVLSASGIPTVGYPDGTNPTASEPHKSSLVEKQDKSGVELDSSDKEFLATGKPPKKPTEPAEPEPSEPTDPEPAEPTPSEPAPGDPGPSDPEPIDPIPAEPEPSQPAAESSQILSGKLLACPGAAEHWCLDGEQLDLGNNAFLRETAPADLDGDGAVESRAEELAGLSGTSVKVAVDASASSLRVLRINGVDYSA